jgi:hypothetical protein
MTEGLTFTSAFVEVDLEHIGALLVISFEGGMD